MLKGDLTTTPLAPLLLQLGADQLTGCLVITDPSEEQAQVFLRGGLVYATLVPGRRPQLGAKLVSSGALAPEQLDEGLEAQRSELHGWRLGELLVHLGYVEQPVVEAFVREQVDDAVWDLMRWTTGTWKFRKNIRTREDVTSPTSVESLLSTLRERGYEWESISAVVHGPRAVPRRSSSAIDPETLGLDIDAVSLLGKIDGERTLAELAVDCGFTQFEAGQVIVSLVGAGLVEINEAPDDSGAQPYGASALAAALQDAAQRRTPDSPAAAEPEATAEPSVLDLTDDDPRRDAERLRRTDESFAASMARVSSALSDVLGPTADLTVLSPETPTSEAARVDLRARKVRERHQQPRDEVEDQRRARHRAAAAAELAAARELADALRPEADGRSTDATRGTKAQRLAAQRAEERAAAAATAADGVQSEGVQNEGVQDVAPEPTSEVAAAAAALAAATPPEPAVAVAPDSAVPDASDSVTVPDPTPATEHSQTDEDDLRRAAAAALREAAAAEPVAPVEDVEDSTAADTPAADTPAAPTPPAYRSDADVTDTAALLRELSSLGAEEEPERPALAPPRPQPRSTADQKKARKKIGLFGL